MLNEQSSAHTLVRGTSSLLTLQPFSFLAEQGSFGCGGAVYYHPRFIFVAIGNSFKEGCNIEAEGGSAVSLKVAAGANVSSNVNQTCTKTYSLPSKRMLEHLQCCCSEPSRYHTYLPVYRTSAAALRRGRLPKAFLFPTLQLLDDSGPL